MKKQIGVILIATLLLFGCFPQSSNAFPVSPHYTDDFGDDSDGSYEDIKYIWVDNNETHLMFKVEVAAPYNDTISSGVYCRIFLSVDNSTGMLFSDFYADYYIRWLQNNPGWEPRFWDEDNTSNRLMTMPLDTGLMYWVQSNNNHTFEIGYRLKSYYNDAGTLRGYLNISLGQTINFKIEMGWTSDWAPDIGEWNLSYTLKTFSGGDGEPPIPGFQLVPLVFGLIVLTVVYFRKKSILT